MKRISTIAIMALLLTATCDTFEIETPGNSNQAVFEMIWGQMDRFYAGFSASTINWDEVYQLYQAQVSPNLAEQPFFDLMAQMLDTLRDSHIRLKRANQSVGFSPEFSSQFDEEVLRTYLTQQSSHAMYTYGKVNPETGYFHIDTFEGHHSGYEHIDEILDELSDCTGIIIDVRRNAGGDENWARYVAGKFYEQNHVYSYYQVRNGPDHDDLSEAVYQECPQAPNARTDVNLVLLIDNTVGSAGEDFVMMLQQIPGITLIGTTTAGLPGGVPTQAELPNGWTLQIPIAAQFTLDGTPLLHQGITPDIQVAQAIPGRDMLIERAIEFLN